MGAITEAVVDSLGKVLYTHTTGSPTSDTFTTSCAAHCRRAAASESDDGALDSS